ncbi:MAG TPA: glycerol-3-phosphate dehydrogenase/oxidase [Acidobacteria bacterium]|nr:glycerol-3-phosphate dehydrogenase/oxidase [Acidobacteriota bacterium]
MKRDLRTLADTRFDLLVVGAGIYGAAIAWDAVQRGLSVAIIDRDDFGGGTSTNSMKTVHGGVRSLQTGNPAELRAFVRERRALSLIAPHLVHPLPFVIPTYGGLTRHPLAMQAAFKVYDFLSSDRNDQPDATKHLPPSRRVSRDECLTLNPLISPDGVTGGIVWHDCQMYNPDRIVLAFVQSAVVSGASAANYLGATGWVREGERVVGVTVEDRVDTGCFEVRAELVVNAAGPWSPSLTADLPSTLTAGRPKGLSKAMNLVTRPITGDHALGGICRSRFLFVAPWRGVSIVGTSHASYNGPGGTPAVRHEDVAAFLQEINEAFPAAGLSAEDIRLVHRGLLPAADDEGAELSKESTIRDHRADGVPGLMSVIGVRYTTARATAERAVDTAIEILDRPTKRSRTAKTPLSGGDIDDWSKFLTDSTDAATDQLGTETRRRIAMTYGSGQGDILRTLNAEPDLVAPLSDECAITRGEIRHAVIDEMAVRLSDAMLRRTEAGSAGHPGRPALESAARIMGELLRWTATNREREIDRVNRYYTFDN